MTKEFILNRGLSPDMITKLLSIPNADLFLLKGIRNSDYSYKIVGVSEEEFMGMVKTYAIEKGILVDNKVYVIKEGEDIDDDDVENALCLLEYLNPDPNIILNVYAISKYKGNSYDYHYLTYVNSDTKSGILYNILQGNFACTCNHILAIQDKYKDFPELECDDEDFIVKELVIEFMINKEEGKKDENSN